jgi:hypothetical protein
MKIVIIIDDGSNESLLRFTETKLFFDSTNMSRDFVNDCLVASNATEAQAIIDAQPNHTYFVIQTGSFLTSSFYHKYKSFEGTIWVDPLDEYVISYDTDTYIGFKKQCKYPAKSKQLYIVENMLKSILAAKKNVYIENTEPMFLKINIESIRHLYGLASGWKTAYLAKQIGLDQLETITVYDANLQQLEWAKKLHSFKLLPKSLELPFNRVGEYTIPDWARTWWSQWHKYPVRFEHVDLLSTPKFPDYSLVWISNVFKFEPLIFNLGWQKLKTYKKDLLNANKQSIIIET